MTPCQYVPKPNVSHNSNKQSHRRIILEISGRGCGCGCGILVTLTWKQRVTVQINAPDFKFSEEYLAY